MPFINEHTQFEFLDNSNYFAGPLRFELSKFHYILADRTSELTALAGFLSYPEFRVSLYIGHILTKVSV
jgi:hypothetical protein